MTDLKKEKKLRGKGTAEEIQQRGIAMSQAQESKMFLRARILRRNLTIAEKILWRRLRAHRLSGAGFRRQHPIGPYVVDFCAPRKKIIVELDGEPHSSQKEYDAARSDYLAEQGYTVIRFWNNEVMTDIEGVIRKIRHFIKLFDKK
jgi:very-short-patch-repair endonuclease